MKPATQSKPRQAPARAAVGKAPPATPYQQRAAVARQDMLALIGVAIVALPVLGMLVLSIGHRVYWPLSAYLVASLASYLLYRHDKQRARQKGWRTPERLLHLSELLGGWPGALLAQRRLRHKTVKRAYQLTFWSIVLLHQMIWLDVLLGGRLHRLLLP